MNNLFDKWKTQTPKYDERFKGLLFDSLTRKFGGSERVKEEMGKHFSNNYELYLYAFFLGLYRDEFMPIPDGVKKVDFNHEIMYWGSKGGRLLRKDFTILQDYVFASLVAKTNIDFIELEKGVITEKEVVKELIYTMEAYTNGGLTLIMEKLEENPNFFLQSTAFLSMILDSKSKNEENMFEDSQSLIEANEVKKKSKIT